MLLRQPAHERVARRGANRAGQRLQSPGEETQKRRLARAVRPDHADDVPGTDAEVELLEQGAARVATGQALRHQGALTGPS